MNNIIERFDSFYAEVACLCKQSLYLKAEGLERFTIKAFNCYARPGAKVLASVQKICGETIYVTIDSVLSVAAA